MSKGQGHDHGECDVGIRVCEYDLDVILMGAEYVATAGAGHGALSVLGLDTADAGAAMPSGVAGKWHEDPMLVGADMKCEGLRAKLVQLSVVPSDASVQVHFRAAFFRPKPRHRTSEMKTRKHGWNGSVGHYGFKNANKTG